MPSKTYTISQAAALLNRAPDTLRQWENTGRLPDHLLPAREQHGKVSVRVYSEELVEHIREFLIAQGTRTGTHLIRGAA